MGEEKTTLGKIHGAAKAEFMEKGFQSASLRSIVKTAGVTTGAFYGYYSSKKDLFKALVGEAYDYIMKEYRQALESFASLPPAQQPEHMGQLSQECMEKMLAYSYEHHDECFLILCCAEGTRYAFMVDEMVELELEATHRYYRVLESLGHPVPEIDERLEHMLVTGMLNAYFEMIIHNMPLDCAEEYLKQLHDFYTAGWMKIMGQ